MLDDIHSGVEVRNHNDDRMYSFHEAAGFYLNSEFLENGLIASDLDDTMFEGDLGVKAFIRKLSEPEFWITPPQEFKKLVLPKSYRAILALAVAGFRIEKADEGLSLNQVEAQLFLDLVEDVSSLYEKIYPSARVQRNINNPLVSEFALKLYLIDKLTLGMDPIFRHGTGGQILMRTRYLLGRKRVDIEEITEGMMAVTQADKDRIVKLSLSGQDNKALASYDRLAPHLDSDGHLKIDQYVGEVEGVRRIIMGLFNSGNGLPVHVVTTNLGQIANVALKNSKYAPLLYQSVFSEGPLTASSLENIDEHGTFGSKMVYPAIFGNVKRERLIGLQESMRRRVILALGDSPSNDTPMMDLALGNGGLCVVVGGGYRETREKFTPFVERSASNYPNTNVLGRVLYIERG